MQLTEVAKGASLLAILDAARRRKLYVVFPTLVLTACVGAYASRVPNSYRAQALLAVEHPPGSDLLQGGAKQVILGPAKKASRVCARI
jgi:uncharacterized protein involved in exopolysaccharide biosynthesis